MKPIYKTPRSREAVLELYDRQLSRIGCAFSDIYVDTTYGQTHIVDTGNPHGQPLLVFHGGNSTTAYNLLACRFLLNDFHVYAVDSIGHPGKSDQVSLSPWNYSYGKWASEVIDRLGFDKMRCFAGSFGGGILAKLMCVAPQKIIRSVLIVPAGIGNAFPLSSAKMMIPLIRYLRTGDDRYVTEAALYMAITKDVLDPDTLDTVKSSFMHVKTKVGMPSNVSGRRMRRCMAPTLVMAGELDCLFPAKKVLKRAGKILRNHTLYELKGRGHMHRLTDGEINRILAFLNGPEA